MKEIDNRKFYDASEAYKMSEQSELEQQQKELANIFNDIDTYVRIGKYECNVHGVSEFQEYWLKAHGYKVEKINKPKHYTNGMIKISWNKK